MNWQPQSPALEASAWSAAVTAIKPGSRTELNKADFNLAVGVGFITWRLDGQPQLLDLALEFKPRALLLSFGDIAPYVEQIKRSCDTLIVQVQSLADARRAQELGADVVVAQGSEAGGHGSNRATMSLVPAVVDALDPLPVVAAGGIADGRGLAASLALGAAGVMLGSRFYASAESLARGAAKQRSVEASGDDTVQSAVFDILRRYEWPAPYKLRALKNKFTDRYCDDLAALNHEKEKVIAAFEDAVQQDDFDHAPVVVGQAVDLIHGVDTAAAIVTDTVAQAERILREGQRRVKA